MLSERKIISQLQQAFKLQNNSVFGIGDDTAVIPFTSEKSYLITQDLLAENQHFISSQSTAAELAHKLLNVNLSDIAAMGGEAHYALFAITIPSRLNQDWMQQFNQELIRVCHTANVNIIGGDTTGGDSLVFSLTVIGSALSAHIKTRQHAQIGDVIAVCGALGEAYAGYQALMHGLNIPYLLQRWQQPEALLREGQWLASQAGVTAMMDISDGLLIDLKNLTHASGVGAHIYLEHLQPSSALIQAKASLSINLEECMLIGGEDYALLMTINDADYQRIATQFNAMFTKKLMPIGRVTGAGLRWFHNGKERQINYKPYSHFGEYDG